MKDSSSWFNKNKGLDHEKPAIGILSFEVTRLMSRLTNLWHCLSDRQMSRLKEEIRYSRGIRTLVSDNYNYLIDLALEEIVDNLKGVAVSVSRLGKKCFDPVYHNLDHVFDNPFVFDLKWCGWEYRLKKMEKRVKKMKKFVAVMLQLYEELESLNDLENKLTKMQSNGVNQGQLQEFHQKVMWQREEVIGLRELSPWVRSYDYVVRLLLRSLFTIVERIKVIFGITSQNLPNSSCFVRKNSISTLAPASVYPSEGSFKRSISNLGHTPVLCGRYPSHKPLTSFRVNGIFQKDSLTPIKKVTFSLKCQEPTLGRTGLALRYANIIILIENLATCTQVMSCDSRDYLYDMLTTSIKQLARKKLFLLKTEASLECDESVVTNRRSSLQRILDWLSPLAHNMIKWYSERNFEKQPIGSGGNVLLVQTLYYADQATSEIAITELIVGLHYVSRFKLRNC